MRLVRLFSALCALFLAMSAGPVFAQQTGALVGKVNSWSHPNLPIAGDPGPFKGSLATG